MTSLAKIVSVAGMVLLGGFFCAVVWKLMTGSISLSYLLDGDVGDENSPDGFSSAPSAGRAQTLLVTLWVASWYLLQVIHTPREFPKVPATMIGVLGGSQALYLGAKLQSMFSGRARE